MKRIVAVLLLCTALVSFAYAVPSDTTVCVTPTGEKYHKIGCSYIHDTYYVMTIQEAADKGYTPCSRCQPGYCDVVESVKIEPSRTIEPEQEYRISAPHVEASVSAPSEETEEKKSGVMLPSWVVYGLLIYVVFSATKLFNNNSDRGGENA